MPDRGSNIEAPREPLNPAPASAQRFSRSFALPILVQQPPARSFRVSARSGYRAGSVLIRCVWRADLLASTLARSRRKLEDRGGTWLPPSTTPRFDRGEALAAPQGLNLQSFRLFIVSLDRSARVERALASLPQRACSPQSCFLSERQLRFPRLSPLESALRFL